MVFEIAELLARWENDDDLYSTPVATIQELRNSVPENLRIEFDKLAMKVKNPVNLGYLVGTIEFFDNKASALSIINKRIPLKGEFHREFSFREFYEDQFGLFKLRDAYGLPNNPKFLDYELDGAIELYHSGSGFSGKGVSLNVMQYGDREEYNEETLPVSLDWTVKSMIHKADVARMYAANRTHK